MKVDLYSRYHLAPQWTYVESVEHISSAMEMMKHPCAELIDGTFLKLQHDSWMMKLGIVRDGIGLKIPKLPHMEYLKEFTFSRWENDWFSAVQKCDSGSDLLNLCHRSKVDVPLIQRAVFACVETVVGQEPTLQKIMNDFSLWLDEEAAIDRCLKATRREEFNVRARMDDRYQAVRELVETYRDPYFSGLQALHFAGMSTKNLSGAQIIFAAILRRKITLVDLVKNIVEEI